MAHYYMVATVEEDLDRIPASVCYNDVEPIKRMIEDPAVNEDTVAEMSRWACFQEEHRYSDGCVSNDCQTIRRQREEDWSLAPTRDYPPRASHFRAGSGGCRLAVSSLGNPLFTGVDVKCSQDAA